MAASARGVAVLRTEHELVLFYPEYSIEGDDKWSAVVVGFALVILVASYGVVD